MCQWFYLRENRELRERLHIRNDRTSEFLDLQAIRQALHKTLEHVERVFFDDSPPRLKVAFATPQGLPQVLELEQLSDGYRNLLAAVLVLTFLLYPAGPRFLRRINPLDLALCAAAFLAGCGGDDKPPATTATTQAAAGPCRAVRAPAPKGEQHPSEPTRRLKPGTRYTVELRTNCGAMTIRLAVARAPRTTASFADLVARGFYDGLTFHRVVRGFVIQGGDPTGTGMAGPGYTVVEPPPA